MAGKEISVSMQALAVRPVKVWYLRNNYQIWFTFISVSTLTSHPPLLTPLIVPPRGQTDSLSGRQLTFCLYVESDAHTHGHSCSLWCTGHSCTDLDHANI